MLEIERFFYADSLIYFVRNQTDDICKLAVMQDGNALRCVNKQTDEIIKLAVQQNIYALRYVRK